MARPQSVLCLEVLLYWEQRLSFQRGPNISETFVPGEPSLGGPNVTAHSSSIISRSLSTELLPRTI